MTLSPGVHAIAEVTIQLKSGDPPRDFITNHLCFNTGAPSVTTAQWQAAADALKGVFFAAAGTWLRFNTSGGKVVMYDRADPKPRPEKAASLFTPSSWYSGDVGPREVALCLSFYSVRNLKRQRGRIYTYPGIAATIAEKPNTTLMNQTLALGTQINTVMTGLIPVFTHEIYSSVDNTDYPVTNYWVNDVWDVQRRRAQKETSRVTHP